MLLPGWVQICQETVYHEAGAAALRFFLCRSSNPRLRQFNTIRLDLLPQAQFMAAIALPDRAHARASMAPLAGRAGIMSHRFKYGERLYYVPKFDRRLARYVMITQLRLSHVPRCWSWANTSAFVRGSKKTEKWLRPESAAFGFQKRPMKPTGRTHPGPTGGSCFGSDCAARGLKRRPRPFAAPAWRAAHSESWRTAAAGRFHSGRACP